MNGQKSLQNLVKLLWWFILLNQFNIDYQEADNKLN